MLRHGERFDFWFSHEALLGISTPPPHGPTLQKKSSFFLGLGHRLITFCRLHKSGSFVDSVQPFFYYEALGGYNYMQFLGKTIWVRKLPREVAFFIWIATLRFFFF